MCLRLMSVCRTHLISFVLLTQFLLFDQIIGQDNHAQQGLLTFTKFFQNENSRAKFHLPSKWNFQGLQAEGVSIRPVTVEVHYGGKNVSDGQIFTLIGANDSGTTLLQLSVELMKGIPWIAVIFDGTIFDTWVIEPPKTITGTTSGWDTIRLELRVDAQNTYLDLNDDLTLTRGLFQNNEVEDLLLWLDLGKNETHSAVGCIRLVEFANGDDDVPELIESENLAECDALEVPGAGQITTTEKVFILEKDSNAEEPEIENTREGDKKFEEILGAGDIFNRTLDEALIAQELYPAGLKDHKNPLDELLNIGAGFGLVLQNLTKGSRPKLPVPPELTCQPQEKTQCENAKMCVRPPNATEFECVCKTGYAGRFCQFSLFPRTCADAFLYHGEIEPGVYQIDLDGSAPALAATFAECLVDSTGAAVTRVENNVPKEGAEIRSAGENQTNKFYPISYKLFSPPQLRELISRSESCRQKITFSCRNSPLNFAKNHTWLEAVARPGTQISQLGIHQHTCACRNPELYGCSKEKNCNCDDITQLDPPQTDHSVLRNASAGITAIYLRRPEVEQFTGSTRLTLEPLECVGEVGTSPAFLVTLKSPTAELKTGAFYGWRQLEFDFRTNQARIESLVSGWTTTEDAKAKGAGEGKELRLKISLRAGHRIELHLAHQNPTSGEIKQLSVSVMSQARLNDLAWHRLVLEMFRGEVRFSIDRLNSFQPLSFPFPTSTQFTVGGDESGGGFVGCVGNFRVDNQLFDWHTEMEPELWESPFLSAGCPELCAESLCEQDAHCVEHFENGTTSCECKNPFIHFGEHCEKNVNSDSAISFHSSAFGYLKFLDEHFPKGVDPLMADLVFSARTDQRRALFVYAHDQYDNFLQVHLADEYRIVLTFNNLSSVRQCAVYARKGHEWSDMRWMQFVVHQTDSSVTLSVNDEMCEIEGRHLLAQEPIAAFTGDFQDAILPPPPAGPVRFIPQREYRLLFVGGVPRAQLTADSPHSFKKGMQTGNSRREMRFAPRLRQRQHRIAYYLSDIPALLGCFRGLILGGQQVDLHQTGVQSIDPDAIRAGCDYDCDSLICHNGGHCSVNWQSNGEVPELKDQRSPPGAPLLGCDCSKTSYNGPDCQEDIGLQFTGDTSLVFDMAEPKRFFLRESTEQNLKFAFSPGNSTRKFAQQLNTIYFNDGREFHVFLNVNGTVSVAVSNSNGRLLAGYAHTFVGNFSDGHRHFFQAHFSSDSQLVILDGDRRYLGNGEAVATLQPLHLANAQLIFLGGEALELGGDPDTEDANESEETEETKLEGNGIVNAPPATESETKQLNIGPEALLHVMRRELKEGNGVKEERVDDDSESSIEQRLLKRANRRERFVGCLSNVEIEFERSEPIRFRPLLSYTFPDDYFHKSVRNDPVGSERLQPASCPGFRVPGAVPSPQRTVNFPIWEAPFLPIGFSIGPEQPFYLVPSQNPKQNDESVRVNLYLIGVIVLFLFFMLLFLLCLCVYYCCRREGKGQAYYPKSNDVEQHLILASKANGKSFPHDNGPMRPIKLVYHHHSHPPNKEVPLASSEERLEQIMPEPESPNSAKLPLRSILRQRPKTPPPVKPVESSSTSSEEPSNQKDHYSELADSAADDDFEDVDSTLSAFDEKPPDVSLDDNMLKTPLDVQRPPPMLNTVSEE